MGDNNNGSTSSSATRHDCVLLITRVRLLCVRVSTVYDTTGACWSPQWSLVWHLKLEDVKLIKLVGISIMDAETSENGDSDDDVASSSSVETSSPHRGMRHNTDDDHGDDDD